MIIKMKIIIVFMLSILFYPPLTTQDGADVKNKIICKITGARWLNLTEFKINQIPKSCDIIDIAWYEFDREGGVIEEDKCLMSASVKAGKTVYTHIGFYDEAKWISIFDPLNDAEFKNQILDPLVNFIQNFNIKGIIIEIYDLYSVKTCDLAQKISDFVCKIKEKDKKLIVGMVFSGYYYQNFTNNMVFNFAITNKVMDLYVIDMSKLNICDISSTKTDVSPLTSTNPDLITIEQVTSSVTSSTMDKSKTFAMIPMFPVIPLDLLPKNATTDITTYSIYCSSTDKTNSSRWCISTPQLLYDQGAFVKKSYNGIVLDQLDTDDYENNCKCGQFPTTNIVIDGWEGCHFKDCHNLN